MNRRTFLKSAALSMAAMGTLAHCSKPKDRPNILWLTAEDMSMTLHCFGDEYAYTPNLDALAAKGFKYTKTYASAPLCTPARTSIITGVFGSSLGTQHLRGTQPFSDQLKGYPQILRENGYYCTNCVKEDYNFKTPDSFWDESSEKAHWRNRPSGKPFFSIFNFMTTHQSRTRYEQDDLDEVNKTLQPEEQHDPAQAPLPPYYADTPKIRTNMAAFYTQVTIMDKECGEKLKELEEAGLAEDTIVFFYSDHGSGLPRGKRWLHDSGIHVPMIIYIPEKFKHLYPGNPGEIVEQLVSFVDLPATALSLGGIKPPEYMHGKAFLGSYKAPANKEIYAIRDRVDEVLEFARSVHDGKYQYIRNFFPHRPRMQRSFYSELTPIRQEMRRLHKAGHLHGDELWLMQPAKPVEELYDVENDPYELDNLAAKPEFQDRLSEMREKVYAWMLKTRDLSLLHENDMIERADGKMPYDIPHTEYAYPIEKIMNVAKMVGQGKEHIPALIENMQDDDPAIRYWAITALSALDKKAAPAKIELQQALLDEKSWVRFAAAEACCNIGVVNPAVDVLAEGLAMKNVKERLHAAEILLVIGKHARRALPAMRQAIDTSEGLLDHGWYMREVLQYIVNEIG